MTGVLEAPAEASAHEDPWRDAAPPRRSGWPRLRADVRLARRQVWRTKGSSALVMLLVLLPVAALAGGAVFWQSHLPSAEQKATIELGRNEAWIQVTGGPDPSRWQAVDVPWDSGVDVDDAGRAVHPEQRRAADPAEFIPAGSTVHEVTEWGAVYVETATGIGNVATTSGDVWDPAFAGRYVAIEGEAPTRADEAMVSPGLLARIGGVIGDDVVLVDSERAFTITGTMRRAEARPSEAELFLPVSAATLVPGEVRWFVEDWQPDLATLAELNHAGFIAYAHDLAVDPPEGARTSEWGSGNSEEMSMLMIGLLLAVFSGYLVVLLAGAAFAVSARRQQRSLAVAASVGAARADVFRIVVLQGTALGAIAGVVGIALGAGLAGVALALTDRGAVGSFCGTWGYKVPWPLLAGVGAFAVIVGTIAAIAPARSATHGDVLGALRGSRRPAVLRAKRPLWGLVLMITGLAATATGVLAIAALNSAEPVDYSHPLRIPAVIAVAFGPVVFQVGFLLAGHWVLVLVARPLSRLGLGPRLASRDSAANPARVVPAFAAIAACVFIASYAISTTALTGAGSARQYWYNGPLHSVSLWLHQNGSAQSGELLDSAEDLLAATSPRATGLISVPAASAYDPRSGLPEDPEHPVDAIAGQPTAQCPTCGDPSSALNGQLSIVPADDVATLLDHPIDDAVLAAYRSGSAIATTPEVVSPDGEVEITVWTEERREEFYAAMNAVDWERDADDKFDHLPGPLDEHRIGATFVDTGANHSLQVLIAPETAAALDIPVVPSQLIAVYDEPLTEAALDRLMAEAEGTRLADGASMSVYRENGPGPVAPWLWLIVGIAAVLVIGASAVVLGLARFERRPDDATLSAVGGSRALRRGVNAWQAAIIVGIGTVVGTAAGLIPVWGTTQSSAEYLRMSDTPWPWLGILAFGLPVAIAVVAWLVPPRHPDLTRRTAIT